MRVRLTQHALEKFAILKKYGFEITKGQVLDTINNPDRIDTLSRSPLHVAQKALDKDHVLRVVYKLEDGEKIIITFYPGRAKQYGKKE